MGYQKDDELRRRINAFFRNVFGLSKDDYYTRLDLKNLLSLKSALSDINNALTMQLTIGFLDWVAKALKLDVAAVAQLRAAVLGTQPRSNGFDIYCAGPALFVAEVKCNIPVNGGFKYGAAQKIGIMKDIDALLHGKSKAASVDRNTLKFMAFIDLPEVRAANEHLLFSGSMNSKKFLLLAENEVPNDPDVVYGVYVSMHLTTQWSGQPTARAQCSRLSPPRWAAAHWER